MYRVTVAVRDNGRWVTAGRHHDKQLAAACAEDLAFATDGTCRGDGEGNWTVELEDLRDLDDSDEDTRETAAMWHVRCGRSWLAVAHELGVERDELGEILMRRSVEDHKLRTSPEIAAMWGITDAAVRSLLTTFGVSMVRGYPEWIVHCIPRPGKGARTDLHPDANRSTKPPAAPIAPPSTGETAR